MSFPKAERFKEVAREGPAPNTYELGTFDRQAGRQGRAAPGLREPLGRLDTRPRALPSLSTTLPTSRQSSRKAVATVSRLPAGLEEAGEKTRGTQGTRKKEAEKPKETIVKREDEIVKLNENGEGGVSEVSKETPQSGSKTISESTTRLEYLEKELKKEKRLREVAEMKAEDARNVATTAGEDLEKTNKEMEEQRRQLVVMVTRLQMAEREAMASREVARGLQERLELAAKAEAVKSEENTKVALETDENKSAVKIEVNEAQVGVVERCTGVSGRAGRMLGEALQVLQVEGMEEAPRSGSRMDFGEKKIFFQQKIEAEVASPAFRERHERIG